MDEGPFRAPQRRVPSRPEAAPKREEEPEPAPVKETPAPKTSYRAERVERVEIPPFEAPKRRKLIKKIVIPVVIVIVILVAGFLGWSAWSKAHTNGTTGIDTSKYQAVFFTNGQVYFGKLQAFNNDYLKLTDIFYLQTDSSSTSSTNPQSTSDSSSNVQLIKLGNEVHGPEDEMIISKEQVLFYENLKGDGKVAQSIDKYTAK